MMVYKYCKQYCFDKLPVSPIFHNDLSLSGRDGEVFEILNHPDKVIKLSIIFEGDCIDVSLQETYDNIFQVLEVIKENLFPVFGRIYSHGYFGKFSRDTYDGAENFILHYYIMEKLNKISDDEKKVFHTILSHEDLNKNKNYSLLQIKEILFDLAKGLDFDTQKVIDFMEQLPNAPVQHLDLHVRNVMKDIENNFKLIDFNRAKIK